MNNAVFWALRKLQKSLLCNTVTVVPCTSGKGHAILVQFETWKLIFVDKKGGNRTVDLISLAINKQNFESHLLICLRIVKEILLTKEKSITVCGLLVYEEHLIAYVYHKKNFTLFSTDVCNFSVTEEVFLIHVNKECNSEELTSLLEQFERCNIISDEYKSDHLTVEILSENK
ncbi:hypothetical protein T10_12405 [Trichinella papuae]|uniref:Uncharacterized protein n=1 Tax=Trichinella papuae TaxID=268474 RepID=A0A0V1MQR2_9BILA|nr:hypothetical protein T10_12405 [Trichinella papuae]